nr:nucleotide-binding protein [uncultured Cohaesibacter sp.]
MQGIDKILKELDQAQKALANLDGTLTTVEFDPDQPASIQAAISKMESAVDACVAPYARNPMVIELAEGAKAQLAEQIREQAAEARTNSEESKEESRQMDGTIFRKIENTINDLKWADMNTFDRHIKKLSSLLLAEEIRGISQELVDLVDLEAWLEAGKATQGGMVGSAELDWPVDQREELGMTIALAHWLAEDPDRAVDFSHTFYYSGGRKITPELQGMVAQVFVPFGRDFIDYVKDATGLTEPTQLPERKISAARKVFVVHGHDEAAKEKMARFLSDIDFEPIILHEQASGNRTVIEKIEAHSDVGFAVVLLTPDDEGGAQGQSTNPRARQNVILELGYFVGKLGRSRVAVFRQGEVEVPSDFGGVVYIPLDGAGAWRQALGKELKEAGFDVDWNVIMK